MTEEQLKEASEAGSSGAQSKLEEAARHASQSGWHATLRAAAAPVRDAAHSWSRHQTSTLGAALAFYTVFAIAPLLQVTIALAGLVYGREAAQGGLVRQVDEIAGKPASEVARSVFEHAPSPSTGLAATAFGFALLLFGAMSAFAELQVALNTVWDVRSKHHDGWLGFLKNRLLSFALVVGTVFLLFFLLVVSAALTAFEGLVGEWTAGRAVHLVDLTFSFCVFTVLFALIYRLVPDARVAWRDVWVGAALTSLLFAVGKTAIGLYLGHSNIASAYGAAGSLIALLLWAYYSAQIFLFGAELTQAGARRFGSPIVADHAEPKHESSGSASASPAPRG